MLPRRCKSCRLYIAPQFTRCPRCNVRAPALTVVKATKEDKAAERDARDAKLPVIKAIHMEWVPSAGAIRAHERSLKEIQRRMSDADTPRLRNTLRSEIRQIKSVLTKATQTNAKRRWTTEIVHTKHSSVTVFISPKGKRYVTATRDGPADLIIQQRKRVRGLPNPRLVLFDRSAVARSVKKDKHEDAAHTKRKKAKKKHRAERRKIAAE